MTSCAGDVRKTGHRYIWGNGAQGRNRTRIGGLLLINTQNLNQSEVLD